MTGRTRAPARLARRVSLIAGITCLGGAVAVAATGGLPAGADNAAGSGFFSFSLTATAPGQQFTYDYPSATPHPQAEGEVPESVANLNSSPQGYALATIAWPGPLAGNAGTTSQLLNLGVPPSQANELNDPARAEARTGSGPPTVTNNSVPGTSMTATATPAAVDSDATTVGLSGPAPQSGSGNTETHSSVKLTGAAQAVATAHSVVHNVSLAGGLVTISSVTSTATATTDGVKGTASGGTVVSGMKIAGQPAYVDEHGLHVGQSGPSAPVNSIAAAIANQALAGFGMKVAVSQPQTQAQGAHVSYDAGNVVFYWPVPSDSHGDTFTVTFGGASVSVTASPSESQPTLVSLPPVAASTPGAELPSAPGGTPVLSDTGSGPSSPAAVPSGPSAPVAQASPPAVLLTPQRAAATLPKGLSPLLPVLVVLGSILVAGGLRRLPDRVLEASSTTCPLGGQP